MLMGSAIGADVSVTIQGLANANGQVLVGLYNKASEFPEGTRVDGKVLPAIKGALTVVFKDLPSGNYAISAFHDINKNGRLDVNMQGIPIEPLGASRDAIGHMGPPSFNDAVFAVGSTPIHLTIHLR